MSWPTKVPFYPRRNPTFIDLGPVWYSIGLDMLRLIALATQKVTLSFKLGMFPIHFYGPRGNLGIALHQIANVMRTPPQLLLPPYPLTKPPLPKTNQSPMRKRTQRGPKTSLSNNNVTNNNFNPSPKLGKKNRKPTTRGSPTLIIVLTRSSWNFIGVIFNSYFFLGRKTVHNTSRNCGCATSFPVIRSTHSYIESIWLRSFFHFWLMQFPMS